MKQTSARRKVQIFIENPAVLASGKQFGVIIEIVMDRSRMLFHFCLFFLHLYYQVANDVFARIGKKVAENKVSLQKINDRVNLTAARVDKLKGSSKATKVFSSAKYPSVDTLELFRTDFTNTDGLREIKHPHYKVILSPSIFVIFFALDGRILWSLPK